jgi:phenylalanyl-tRNA synthetase beta subunit
LSFTIYIQSNEETLNDTIKNKLIEDIIKNVEKLGGKLRS